MCGCLSHASYEGPGMCPDWESFGVQSGAQSTEPHQPGLNHVKSILTWGS